MLKPIEQVEDGWALAVQQTIDEARAQVGGEPATVAAEAAHRLSLLKREFDNVLPYFYWVVARDELHKPESFNDWYEAVASDMKPNGNYWDIRTFVREVAPYLHAHPTWSVESALREIGWSKLRDCISIIREPLACRGPGQAVVEEVDAILEMAAAQSRVALQEKLREMRGVRERARPVGALYVTVVPDGILLSVKATDENEAERVRRALARLTDGEVITDGVGELTQLLKGESDWER